MKRRDAIKRTALIMGYAVSASAVAGVMAGCEIQEENTWIPKALSLEQGGLVAEIAEIILPKTDTPGAKDVLVHQFIDFMIAGYLKPAEKKVMMDGLAMVDAESQKAHQKNFLACTPEQQKALLTTIANAAQKEEKARKPGPDAPHSFFWHIKQLTLLGYFTSAEVGKNVLNYDPIPGAFKGCVPLEEVGNKSWTIMR